MRKFAAFILTHGRPDNVVTYKTLRACGYTGDVFFIVDNEDATVDRRARAKRVGLGVVEHAPIGAVAADDADRGGARVGPVLR